MPAKRQYITLADFSGGDEGVSRPLGVSDPTTFRALNVWKYHNGIGPRQPVTAFAVSSNYTKAIQLFDLVPGEQVIVVYKDKTVRRIDTGVSTTPGGTGFTNLPDDSCSLGGTQVYVSSDGTGAVYNVLGNDLSDNANIIKARRILLHGPLLVVFPVTGVSPDAQSVNWSGLGPDVNSWPVANTLQVSPSEGLAEMWEQGDNLLLTSSGGQIYMITGVLGINEVQRTVALTSPINYQEDPPYEQGGTAQLGKAWWKSGTNLVIFDGARVSSRPGLERPSSTPTLASDLPSQFLNLDKQGEFMWVMPGADSGASTTIGMQFHHADDSFTQHEVPVTSYTAERAPRVLGTYSRFYKRVWLATGGSDSQAPLFYKWEFDGFFPSTTSDGNSGVPVTATFRSGDFLAPVGTAVRVHSVTVDYSYKPSEVGSSNVQFDIAVESLSQDDDITTYTSTTQSFTPSSTVTDSPDFATIQRGRRTFGVGEQGEGAGFRVKISNWRGIIIHQITAAITTEEYQR